MRQLHQRIERVGPSDPWAAWARAQLEGAPEPVEDSVDAAYDRTRTAEDRERLGQVFTPPLLARALADLVRAERPGSVLDPAAGDGSLLLAVADRRVAHGHGTAQVLDALTGWDLDPLATWLCRIALVDWALDHAGGPIPGPLRVSCRDGLGGDERFDLVVSNPPYLEAKRMGRAQPGLRERLREAFPELTGAFDLYLAFALESLTRAPVAGLILPNKVCQGRYAARFRERVTREGRLAGLLDLARVRPRPFRGTGVYPVVLHLERGTTLRAARCETPGEVASPGFAEVSHAALASVGGELPWFVPFDTWPVLAPLFQLPRLGSVARIVTTCSFHKAGLRERFVTPDKPASRAFPYLGGPSRAKQTEIQPFQERWAGWWIAYEQDRLRTEHGNSLPPLAIFQRPKALFNQHDRRMSAWADAQGRFVSKDVYPVAWPEHADWTLSRLVGLFNATVFTALYNTVFQGIVVGGETYHYLPAFLAIVPVPDGRALTELDELVPRMQDAPDGSLWERIDRVVTAAYGLTEADRAELVSTHLTRVGAPAPGRP
ncbi:MAG: N-6 DNA methylase [Myxococcota bacterium]